MKTANPSAREPMTPRERVLAVAKGLPVDRTPVMYWLNPHTTCRLLAEYRPGRNRVVRLLASYLWRRFIQRGEFDAPEWVRALPLLFEEYGNGTYVLELGADVSIQSPALTSPINFVRGVRWKNGRLRVRGPFGTTMGLGGIYMEPLELPIKNADDLNAHQLPPIVDKQFAAIRNIRQAHPETCILVEVASLQQAACDFMIGTMQFMLALYDYPDAIEEFMGRMADWIIEMVRCAVRAGADIVYLQDDYGMTDRPLISVDMWREYTFPHLKRIVDAAHDAGVPIMLHSCGYQMPFLDYYVKVGVDVLQSFQPKAGNDFEAAYEKYGDRLTFATGIDVQQGERMTPRELRDSILRSYEIGRHKGRHILAMTHMMQYTMPLQNVRAILDTVWEIQRGRHD